MTKEAGHEHDDGQEKTVRTGSILTTSVESLMKRHSMAELEFVKIDIEGAENEVFSEDQDLSWLRDTDLMAMEIHSQDYYFDLVGRIKNKGLVGFTQGEYTFFASPQIATTLNIPQWEELLWLSICKWALACSVQWYHFDRYDRDCLTWVC